ncbi:unnamed protein product [Orchesella dallaii]|uniref:Uncharacterized protein n=1 Tax=Orchesella dallaii TaxID=48710 RepID=A0ABP1RPS6_9HEXA
MCNNYMWDRLAWETSSTATRNPKKQELGIHVEKKRMHGVCTELIYGYNGDGWVPRTNADSSLGIMIWMMVITMQFFLIQTNLLNMNSKLLLIFGLLVAVAVVSQAAEAPMIIMVPDEIEPPKPVHLRSRCDPSGQNCEPLNEDAGP